MSSFIDPDKLDPDTFVDSRYRESLWQQYETPILIASIVYWLLSAAYFAWLSFGVDPDAELSLGTFVIGMLSLVGLIIFPTMVFCYVLQRIINWLSPPEFKP
jgi:hypothetical protein